ncbi:MAG: hypothetical protein QOF33_965 [Thermomicrobiales bacterium]|nr:hypothetical protein [Thermomicrobiales bacterium]
MSNDGGPESETEQARRPPLRDGRFPLRRILGRRRKDFPEAQWLDQDSRPHVVIIGGGFGGLNAAKALRDAPVRITLVDARNYHLFQPLLYQVATASLAPADIASPIRAVLRRQKNVTVLMDLATDIDLDAREVVLAEGRFRYDYLILAAGAQPVYFGHPEWQELAPGLKSIEDAVEMRRRIFRALEAAERETVEEERRCLLTFVVVGGGPTGVELAGSLGEIIQDLLPREYRFIRPEQARIVLVEGGPRVLSAFPEKLSRAAERDLRRLGVELRTNTRVTGIEPGTVWLGEERIGTETVLWAAGVTAAPLARTLGAPLDRGGRVVVQPDLTVPGHSEVFVIGDVAATTDAKGRPLPGVAPVAIQQGQWSARNIVQALAGEPLRPFRYRDRGILATVGRRHAVAVVFGVAFDGVLAWLTWAVVHVASLIEFRSRFAVMLQWAWAYVTRQRTSRLITEELRLVPLASTSATALPDGDRREVAASRTR